MADVLQNIIFLTLISGNQTILEKEPLESATKKRQLYAFKHKGFQMHGMHRDKNVLEQIFKKNKFN